MNESWRSSTSSEASSLLFRARFSALLHDGRKPPRRRCAIAAEEPREIAGADEGDLGKVLLRPEALMERSGVLPKSGRRLLSVASDECRRRFPENSRELCLAARVRFTDTQERELRFAHAPERHLRPVRPHCETVLRREAKELMTF